MRLVTRIFAMFAVTFVAVVVVEIFAGRELRNNRIESLRDETLQHAHIVSLDMARVLEGTRLLLTAVAKLPAGTTRWDTRACNLLKAVARQHSQYDHIVGTDRDGRIACSSSETDVVGLPTPDRALFERIVAARAFAVGWYRRHRASDSEQIGVGFPVLEDDGTFAGIVYAGIKLSWLNAELERRYRAHGVDIAVTDRDGTLIGAHPDPKLVGRRAAAHLLPFVRNNAAGFIEPSDENGQPRFFAFVPSDIGPSRGLAVFVSPSSEEALAEIDRSILLTVGATLGGLLLAMILVLAFVRRYLDAPLRSLLAIAGRWRSGDWSARTVGASGTAEFDRLASAFDSMAAEVEGRNESLKYRDALLHALTTSAANLVASRSLTEAIPSILATVGTALHAERILVLELPEGSSHPVLRHVWHGPAAKIELKSDYFQHVVSSVPTEIQEWVAPLYRGHPVALVRRQAHGHVARIFDDLGIKSSLQAPLLVDGRVWGILAVDDCLDERQWSPGETDAVSMLADLIGASIARARHVEKLSNADEIVRNSPAILYRLSIGRHVTLAYVSENIAQLGHDPGRLLTDSRSYWSIIHPDDRIAVAAVQDNLKSGAPNGTMELRLADAHGDYRWFENRYQPRRDAEGRLTEVAGVLVDVSERRAAADRLQFANTLLTTQAETSPDAILVVDNHRRIVSFNHNFLKLWGLADDVAVAGDDVAALSAVRPLLKDPEAFGARIAHLYAHPEMSAHDEIELIDGRCIDRHTAPLHTAEGTYLGRIWFFRDITERRKAERELVESEMRFRSILQATSDGVAVIDGETERFILVNQALCDMLGYDRAELASLPIGDIYMAAELADCRHRIQRTLAGERTMGSGVRLRPKDGRSLVVDISAARMELGGRPLIVAVYRDVTERQRMQSALQRERDFSAALIDGLPGIFFVLDSEGRNVRFNAGLCEATGRSAAELRGSLALDNVAEADRPSARQKIRAALSGEERTPTIELDLLDAKGGSRRYLISAMKVALDDGPGIVGVGIDVTEARRTEKMLRASEQRFRAIFAAVSDGIFVRDLATGRILEANQSACDMFGYTREELLTRSFADLSSGVPPYTEEEAYERLAAARSDNEPVTFEWQHRAKTGRVFFTEVTIRKVSFGEENFFLSTIHNITERKRHEQRILQMARFDSLTGLANRSVFTETIDKKIAAALRGGGRFAVLYLDLDHFKDVNDTLGHPTGDVLLTLAGQRLRRAVRDEDIVARFGGDEFAVMQADMHDPTDAGLLAERLLSILDDPYIINGNEIRCGASIGIAVYGPDATEAETLLSRADVALYRAKSEGRSTYRFFTAAMDDEVRTRVNLSNELRHAIGTDRIFLEYQPQVETATGRIIGVEALARWQHPTMGLVPPAVFIPVAERNGLIGPFEQWALREACRQSKAWRDAGIVLPILAVNVSALRFKAAMTLESEVANVLDEFDVPPGHLELELTESVLMDASQHHNDVLVRLRDRGVRLAIDDFGTGYSSLDYLRRFPVDRMKIAQNFILDLDTKAENAVIVRAAIGIARELGISVLAEGVETEVQLDLLQQWGCRDVQGFYFARPMSAQALEPLLRAGRIVAPEGRGA